MDHFTDSYLETAEWADKPDGEDWSGAEWSDQAMAIAESDCQKFQDRAREIIERLEEGAQYHFAHDFWLTRQGHGAGFWDGDYPEPEASELTEIAKSFGEVWIYLGDDGLIYFS